MKNKPVSIIAASLLMIILALTRGSGGVILLMKGKNIFPDIVISDSTLYLLAAGLLFIGIVELISAVGIYLLKRSYRVIGIITTVLFVFDGAINGYFLYGKPDGMGTTVNIVFAILIILFLYIAKNNFEADRLPL